MAATATRPLISPGRVRLPFLIGAGITLILSQLPTAVEAQSLYRYRDGDGYWVYTDRHPSGAEAVEAINQDLRTRETGVWLYNRTNAVGTPVLVAINGFASWVQIAYRVEYSRNLKSGTPTSGNSLLPPQSETHLMALAPIDTESPTDLSFSYQYIYGHPRDRHRTDEPYRLPYALTEAHRISQAYPDVISHSTVAQRHAVDFEMPIGTQIFAAREGLVIEASGEFFRAGLNLERNGNQANFVRILHDDGTLALYGHLSWRSIRVVPGQRVSRGEHIADSGNTGYSTGPHLHFVVQRNRAGAAESVAVTFAGAAGTVLIPETGDHPVAYRSLHH